MANYNYHVLSPTEFENLARDLVQRKENIVLETFKEGKDSGIDLRYAEVKDATIIVQAKRYQNDYEALLKVLKNDELGKVNRLKPNRYILVTSVGLTPANKTAIMQLFSGYIKSTADIIGKEDIDNLVGLYPDLEKKHYKLWLTSTNILQEIVNSKEINQSRFELEQIVDEIKFFVQNDSFDKAKDILERERFVIISGIPGIGKTTLARMLAYNYLANGYEDFIYISGNIAEAYSLYNPGRKQVFLYDDFLGENFLSEKLSKNEDKQLLAFIGKIKRDKDKLLFMTTREYILRQAEIAYPLVEELQSAKATIELASYTPLIRAQILFNHLFFNNVKPEFLENILENNNYAKIIAHENYNPRIIAAIAKDKLWETVKAEDFTGEIIKYLDNPYKVWENVFETKITDLSRLILLVLTLAGAPMLLEDLSTAVSTYRSFSSSEFKAALRELEHTFVISEADVKGTKAIDFQNHSIRDYLLNYLKDNRKELLMLLKGITFINQGFDVFEFPKKENDFGLTLMRDYSPIPHDTESLAILKHVLVERLLTLEPSSKVAKITKKGEAFEWLKTDNNKLRWVEEACGIFNIEKDEQFRAALIRIVSEFDLYNIAIDENFDPLLNIRTLLQHDLPIDQAKLIKAMARKVTSFRKLEMFCKLGALFKKDFLALRDSHAGLALREKASKWCQQEFAKGMSVTINPPANDFFMRIFFKAEMERICDEINYISGRLNLGIFLDSEYHKEYVREKLKENALPDDLEPEVTTKQMNAAISEMFNSFRQR